jgi:serine/threonine protein kinase
VPVDCTMGVMSGAKQAPDAESGPKLLGRYRIGERIGSGGTAEVYRAEVEGASGFAKTLVVKCLRPALVDEPELVEGLAREAKLAQRLQHGNIVQVLDFGVEDGRPYVVMEHVDGCSLHELCADLRRRGERMGLPEALFVVEEVAAALRYAHGLVDEQGVPLRLVHRDVKPRNVLVSHEGVVKLADFGIAKLADDHEDTLPGVIKGTPAWLAPEQALGRGVDARTDVFALGRLLRELVGGDGDASPAEAGSGPHADPSVDEALREVWQRATADAPEDRFPDVQAMLRALQRWRATRDLDVEPGQLPAWVRRARRQPPVARPMALDAALLGAGERDVTITSAAQGSTPTTNGPAVFHRGWVTLGVAFLVSGVMVAMWANERQGTPGASERLASSRTTSSHDHDPAPADRSRVTTVAPDPDTSDSTASRRATGTAAVPTTSPGIPTSPGLDATADSAASLGVPSREPSTRAPEPPPVHRREPAPVAEPGRLRVNVLPWAEVTVDGRSLGRVPIDVELAPGRYRVKLENPQLGERTFEIELAAGGEHKITRW